MGAHILYKSDREMKRNFWELKLAILVFWGQIFAAFYFFGGGKWVLLGAVDPLPASPTPQHGLLFSLDLRSGILGFVAVYEFRDK